MELVAQNSQQTRRPRCPFCHDDVAPAVPRVACEGCAAWHHDECWTEGEGCSACGRGRVPLPAPRTAEKGPQAYLPDRPGSLRTLRWLLLSFQGRIPRRTYVSATLLAAFATIAMMHLVDATLGGDGLPGLLVLLPYLWATFALQAKRFHDQGKSAWWTLINLFPMLGGMLAFVLCAFTPSQGPNHYGPGPN